MTRFRFEACWASVCYKLIWSYTTTTIFKDKLIHLKKYYKTNLKNVKNSVRTYVAFLQIHSGPVWNEILLIVSTVPSPNGEKRFFVSRFWTSTTQTAEYNDMDNEWELILDSLASTLACSSSPSWPVMHVVLVCPVVALPPISKVSQWVSTVQSIRKVGSLQVWTAQGGLQSVNSAFSFLFLSLLTHSNESAAFAALSCGGASILQDTESLIQGHRCLRLPNAVDVKLQRHSFWYFLLHRFHLNRSRSGSWRMQSPSSRRLRLSPGCRVVNRNRQDPAAACRCVPLPCFDRRGVRIWLLHVGLYLESSAKEKSGLTCFPLSLLDRRQWSPSQLKRSPDWSCILASLWIGLPVQPPLYLRLPVLGFRTLNEGPCFLSCFLSDCCSVQCSGSL